MNYAEIKKYDIANGPGVRVSLFVSGCTIHCKGCFNPETWDPSYGKPFGEKEINEIVDFLKLPYAKGLTILGGEPLDFDHPKELLQLTNIVHNMPDKDLWIFTGHNLEWVSREVKSNENIRNLLIKTDVLVEGPFMEQYKDPSLKFRGSKNQTIVEIGKTLAEYYKTGKWHTYFSEYQSEEKTDKEILKERLYLTRCANRHMGLLGKVGPLPDEEDKKEMRGDTIPIINKIIPDQE